MLQMMMDEFVVAIKALRDRLAVLEKQAAKPVMIYLGDWQPGYEYDPGNVVTYAGTTLVAIQPINGTEPRLESGWQVI